MKSLLIAFMLVACFSTMAQTGKKPSHADPKLGQIILQDMAGRTLDPESLRAGQIIRLRIPVSNADQLSSLPAGSAKIKIGFGSKFQLDPSFNLSNAGMENYFTWAVSTYNNGQLQVTGDLTGEFPQDLNEIIVSFKVKALAVGSSTITANFLITNHAGTGILSDKDPNNNAAFLAYSIQTKTVPAPVIKIDKLDRASCAINVEFSADREDNFSRYDVEVSKDGITYVKAGEVTATDVLSYKVSFNLTADLQVPSLLVRVRSVDMNGKYIYSYPQTVTGICNKSLPWSLSLYPNPAIDVKSVVISTAGEFRGKYKISLLDASGQRIQGKEIQLERVSAFTYNFGTIANGMYMIQLINTDGTQSGTLKFEKL